MGRPKDFWAISLFSLNLKQVIIKDMNFSLRDSRGMNYVELILAMAIIGILFTITFTFMTLDYRRRANDVAALGIMQGLVSDARFCVGNGSDLKLTGDGTPDVGRPICENTRAIWPEMVIGWEYKDGASSVPYEGFYFSASSTHDSSKGIICTPEGCTATWDTGY